MRAAAYHPNDAMTSVLDALELLSDLAYCAERAHHIAESDSGAATEIQEHLAHVMSPRVAAAIRDLNLKVESLRDQVEEWVRRYGPTWEDGKEPIRQEVVR